MTIGIEMEKKYIIAIDGGTQSTKLVIFDTTGHEICSETVQLRPIHFYGDNRAEHLGDDLWESLKKACHGILEKFDKDPGDIIGVGLGSIRCCRALIREDGNLASCVQSWMDLRMDSPYVHGDDSVRYVTTSTGYLTYRLTGETRDTRCNYTGPWPIDPGTLEWYEDGERFDAYMTPREMLFELVDPASVLGNVTEEAGDATGLPAGIPVVSTANDKAVEGLGAGLGDDGTVLVSLGTYITSMMAGARPDSDTVNCWSNPGAVPGEFLYESTGIRRGMATVTWVKELLGSDIVEAAKKKNLSPEDYLSILGANVPAGCDGLYTVLNWLPRPGRLHERGIMIGFNNKHKGPHIFRSVLEGIALTMKNHTQAMCDEMGAKLDNIIVSGGGSNSELFMQIFADVYGVPAHRNEVNGSASMGAAICTALALGIYRDRQQAVENMVRLRDTFTPLKENAELYRKINKEVYQHIVPVTDSLLVKSSQILNNRG